MIDWNISKKMEYIEYLKSKTKVRIEYDIIIVDMSTIIINYEDCINHAEYLWQNYQPRPNKYNRELLRNNLRNEFNTLYRNIKINNIIN